MRVKFCRLVSQTLSTYTDAMKIIKTTQELSAFCEKCAAFEYVTVDTEFLRERTYYSKLCLGQMAHPGDDADSAAIIDPLSPDCHLPLYRAV